MSSTALLWSVAILVAIAAGRIHRFERAMFRSSRPRADALIALPRRL